MGRVRGPHSWVDDDFIDCDSNSKALLELDPWNPDMPQGDPSWRSLDESGTNTLEIEDAAATSWDVEDLRDDVLADQWDDISVDVEDWVEPDPTEDAFSGLGESLYPPDDSITNISRELKIGEFLALVVPCTKEQRARCYELLSACGVGRLRHLIPWLRNHAWCGDKLQLFLEFRGHWEVSSNVRWWEIFHWSFPMQAWVPQYSKATLTLDHTRELVEKRGNYTVTEVIGRSWFDDWEDCVAWELGIQSFANFAVFRASIPDGNRWQEYLVPHDRRTALEIAQCTDPGFAPFMLPSEMRQYSCPRVVAASHHPWPDVTETAQRRASALGGNQARAWEEIMDRMTDC